MPEHIPGEEIRTKQKEAIRQLYKQAKFMAPHLREEVRPIKSEIGIYDFAKYDFTKYINFQCKTH